MWEVNRAALVIGALGYREQVVAEQPVADHQAGGDPYAAPRSLREESVDRGPVGPEDQRRGGTRPDQTGQEVASHT